MKEYLKKTIPFFIPIMIFLIGMIFNKIYPFGDKILPMLDGYTQYPGFLNIFKEIIFNHNSLFYSFKGLTGFNLYATSIYYTFNLTNLLFLLFKTSHIIDFYTIIIPIKLGLCSITMLTFLNYLGKKKYNYLFSICYALTTYNLLYYLNYMWFDSIILLPLVILGTEKIFKENKYYYYVITLTISIISNFYIGYMICIFSLIYFIYKWIINKHPKDKLFKFIFYSLLSGLMTSFTLIPIVLELLKGKSSLITTTNYLKFDLDFLNIFYKLTIGSFLNGDLEYGTPNIYVSIFIYLNTIMYFFNKKINKKERILSFIVLSFFLLSVSFNFLDYFWQMLAMPIYYPVRYGFIFDFFLIYLAYKNYEKYDNFSAKRTISVAFIILILSIIGFFTSGNLLDKVNVPAKLIYLGISIMFILYYLFIINNKDFKKYIFIVILIELSVNTFVTLRNNGNMNSYNEFKTNYQTNYEALSSIDNEPLTRLAFDQRTIKNNGLLLNYNDLNYFSSIRNSKTYTLLNKTFGILTIDDCNTEYYFNNPITNALLNIKYFITKDNLNYYDLIKQTNNYNIYKNNDASSIGFVINKLDNYKQEEDYQTNINNLIKIINNNDHNILKEVPIKDSNISCNKETNICITNGSIGYINYEYTSKDEEFLFIQNDYPIGKDETNYTITINDNTFTYNTHYPIKITKGDKISLTINPKNDFKTYYYHLYIVNFKEYQKLITNINQNKLIISDYQRDSNFKANINLEEDSFVFTSISNDNGWKVYIDDKETKITPILDGFIGLNIPKGEHTITFKYTPPGLKIGLLLTTISLLTFSLTLTKKKASK